MKKKVTIQDIANELGISRNTVSKAINNSEGIAESTRDKILMKAVEMDYRPFSYVRAFTSGLTTQPEKNDLQRSPVYLGQIAIFSGIFLSQSHFASVMLDKFQCEIAQLGYTINAHRVTEEDIRLKRLPVTFLPEQYTGIICFELFDREYDEMLCALDIPILFVDGPCKKDGFSLPADQLYMNNQDNTVRFVNEMLGRGYRRIGWIGNPFHCQSFFERYIAFRCAMMMAGVPVHEAYVIRSNASEKIWAEVKSLKELPDLFICANDFIALDVLQMLSFNGIMVPRDVMLSGFDDCQESGFSNPGLTTIHIHTQIMAFSAAHLLISRIREPSLDYRAVYTETELVLRDSTELKG